MVIVLVTKRAITILTDREARAGCN